MITLEKKMKILAIMMVGVVFLYAILFFLNEKVFVSGGCSEAASGYLHHKNEPNFNITYCEKGDIDTAILKTDFFKSKPYLYLEYSGYPKESGVTTYLELKNGDKHFFSLENAGEVWKATKVRVPSNFEGKYLRVVFQDGSETHSSWVGLGNVSPTQPVNFKLLLYVLAAIFAINLAVVAVFSYVSKRKSGDLDLLVIKSLVCLGFLSYLSFFIYFINPLLGKLFTVAFFGFVFVEIYLSLKNNIIEFKRLNALLLPVVSYTFFILFIGLVAIYHGEGIASVTENRWLHLPIDNWIPKIFADQLSHGKVLIPMIGDWLSSDRPPLQTGFNLLMFADRSDLIYQVSSSYLQALVLLPIYLIAKRARNSNATSILVLFGCSSLMAVNTLYVWPKLISACFVLIYFISTCTSVYVRLEKVDRIILIGSSAAFSMLCHGGAFFAIVPITVLYLIREWKEGLSKNHSYFEKYAPLLASVLIYFPWMLYQKIFDPPGNRLMKWHLAGVVPVDSTSLVESLVRSYGSLSFGAWLDGRVSNFKLIFGNYFLLIGDFLNLFKGGEFLTASKTILGNSFFLTSYSMWFLSPLVVILFWAILSRRNPYFTGEKGYLLSAALGTLFIWSLMMFDQSSTYIHQGSYFSWISLFLICGMFAQELFKRAFMFLLILNGLIFFFLYVTDIVGEFSGFSAFLYMCAVLVIFCIYILSWLNMDKVFDVKH